MALYDCKVTPFYESGTPVTLSRLRKVRMYAIILRTTTKNANGNI